VRSHLRPFQLATVVVAAVAVAASLAGCGGKGSTTTTAASSTTPTSVQRHVNRATYDRIMQRYGRTVSRSIEGLYPLVDRQVGSEANKEAAAKVEKARATVGQVAASLAALIPPAPVRGDHRRLVVSLGKLQAELATLEKVLEQGGSKPFGTYTEFGALQTIRIVTDDMTKKGFSVD
jgi:predicted small lipoprotein YifL